jgi:predicted acyltransferase
MIAQGNLLQFRLDHLKVYSNTLQSIAAGYLVAVIALVELRTAARQASLCAALLVSFALIMLFVPWPGGVTGSFAQDANLAWWIDKTIMGHFMDGWGYTWILSSLGFAATVIMGSLAGHMLKSPLPGMRKVLILTAAGIVCLIMAWALNPLVPIIKHLWTSSMVLWAGGWSLLLLALFYLIIDVLGYKRWAFPLQVIGANAIVAYMAEKLFDIEHICKGLFGGLCTRFGPAGHFTLTCLSILFLWSLLYYLYRNRTFVRI